MKKTLLFVLLNFISFSFAQTISIVGTGVNGWPPTNGPEITLSTTDNTTYTITNLLVSNGLVKFRQDYLWTTNWGGSTFPNGQGVLNGTDIPTQAGIYDVTFNRVNGTYTFIGTPFPSIGIWGPAVDSQNGYGGPDVDMITSDGITYTLSGFNFSSGNAYFRQDNTTTNVWGSTSFPSGTAALNGPSLFIPGNEWFVTFNRITGAYSFEFPIISIRGTAALGWNTDLDMNTNDGFNYSIEFPQGFSVGELKFRKNRSWDTNWGGNSFPNGTGVLNGNNVVVSIAGFNFATFERTTGVYLFAGLLGNDLFSNSNAFNYYPNPTKHSWIIKSNEIIEEVKMNDITGKIVYFSTPKSIDCTIDGSSLNNGIYFTQITTPSGLKTFKLVKN